VCVTDQHNEAFRATHRSYTHLKQWCERAKEKTFTKFGHSKSSLKRRPFQPGNDDDDDDDGES